MLIKIKKNGVLIFKKFRFKCVLGKLGIKKNKSLNLAALVAAFSICIGVATITIATSIINGFEYAILKHTLGVTSDIVIFYREKKPNWEAEEAWLKSQENVQAIEKLILNPIEAKFPLWFLNTEVCPPM